VHKCSITDSVTGQACNSMDRIGQRKSSQCIPILWQSHVRRQLDKACFRNRDKAQVHLLVQEEVIFHSEGWSVPDKIPNDLVQDGHFGPAADASSADHY
jgi:hypothetical protein